jgi:hypothetical protein
MFILSMSLISKAFAPPYFRVSGPCCCAYTSLTLGSTATKKARNIACVWMDLPGFLANFWQTAFRG